MDHPKFILSNQMENLLMHKELNVMFVFFFFRVSPSKRMPAVGDPLTTRDLTNQRRDKTISPTKGNFGPAHEKIVQTEYM